MHQGERHRVQRRMFDSAGPKIHAAKPMAASWSFAHEVRPDPTALADPSILASAMRPATGPGTYELPRSCEAQNDSTRASAPNSSFGYRGQNAGPVKAPPRKRVPGRGGLVEVPPPAAGSRYVPPAVTPGPGNYQLPTTLSGATRRGGGVHEPVVGDRLGSPCVRTAPAASLAGRERFGSIGNVDDKGAGPGPAKFATFAPGVAELPTQRASAKCRFGSALRKDINEPSATPGPGSYMHDLSSKVVKHAPPKFSMAYRIVRADRHADRQGPGRCREDSAIGIQRTSTQKSAAAFSFGSRTFVPGLSSAANAAEVPGPGAYGDEFDDPRPKSTKKKTKKKKKNSSSTKNGGAASTGDLLVDAAVAVHGGGELGVRVLAL